MQYQSTRNKNLKAGSAQAILDGLAPDGGLYTMPSFDEARFDYREILNLDTFSMSARILAKLLPDFSEQEMASLVRAGYGGTTARIQEYTATKADVDRRESPRPSPDF